MLSANLGFLYSDHPLPQAVAAAAEAGFSAIECHFPFDTPVSDFRAALEVAGLPLLALNTWPGDRQAGDFGLAALAHRVEEARVQIDRAIDYAAGVGAQSVHVMAGRTDGGSTAESTFRENLGYALERASPHGISILIEPINHRDVPGYHLATIEQAAAIVSELSSPGLKIMFDCYHVQIAQGDLLRRFERHIDMIGHVQVAAVPDRGEPDEGEISFERLIPALRTAGYRGAIGAEYRPRGPDTETGLHWMQSPWAQGVAKD